MGYDHTDWRLQDGRPCSSGRAAVFWHPDLRGRPRLPVTFLYRGECFPYPLAGQFVPNAYAPPKLLHWVGRPPRNFTAIPTITQLNSPNSLSTLLHQSAKRGCYPMLVETAPRPYRTTSAGSSIFTLGRGSSGSRAAAGSKIRASSRLT